MLIDIRICHNPEVLLRWTPVLDQYQWQEFEHQRLRKSAPTRSTWIISTLGTSGRVQQHFRIWTRLTPVSSTCTCNKPMLSTFPSTCKWWANQDYRICPHICRSLLALVRPHPYQIMIDLMGNEMRPVKIQLVNLVSCSVSNSTRMTRRFCTTGVFIFWFPVVGAAGNDDDEENRNNRDWLDWFYVFSRVVVLFSVVYFYSTPLRLLAVSLLLCMFYL